MSNTNKLLLLVTICFLCIIGITFVPPIAQDPAYHDLIDKQALHGIQNFWNVLSNLPFVLFGLLGLYKASQSISFDQLRKLQLAYTLFFTGAIFIGTGSSYYHLAPSNETLLWDRLPMAITFMAFFSIIIAEYISLNTGRFLLIPLLALGAGSVIYWFQTEQAGAGDLRAYALVQFLPMLLIPLILVLFKGDNKHSGYIWLLLVTYVLSKISEYFDVDIYNLTGVISGHSIKHLFASLGIFIFYLYFSKHRKLVDV